MGLDAARATCLSHHVAELLLLPFRSLSSILYLFLSAAHFLNSVPLEPALAQASMANSGWTMEHVAQLFWGRRPPARVWPPCDTAELAALPLQRKLKRLYLVSLAQVLN